MSKDVTERLNSVLLNVESSEKEIRKQIEQGHAGLKKVQEQINTLEGHLQNTLALKMLLIHASTHGEIRESVASLLGDSPA